ncbi:metaxin 1 [Nannochloropsis oceanica]
MFSSADFFESDFSKNPLGAHTSSLCPGHAVDPNPIKAHAEGKQPLILLQFRPAFALQLYLRFVRAPYVVRNLEYPFLETAGRLPVLIDGQFIIPEDDALAYLREHYPSSLDLDSKLSGAKRAQVSALHALVSEKLAPALGASRYRDERNFVQNVRDVILRATRFPLGPTWASAERRRGMAEQRWRGLVEGGVGLGELLARARVVYRELDNWLGASTGDFFFGREPTSFDACLFGHLVEALADVNVLVIVSTFGNLMRFFRRIAEEFFEIGSATVASSAEQQQQQGFVVASNVKEYYKRADYVNSRNPFNQVKAAKLCAEAPLVPEPMLHKFLEEGEGPKGGVGGVGKKQAGTTAAGPEGGKKAEELEEERARHKENVIWLTVVGGVVGFFLLFQGIMALATGEIEIVTEGEEEEVEEGG